MKKSSKSLFTVAVIGAGLGYLTGILSAKQSGKETRKDISETSKKAQAKAEASVSSLYKELSDVVKQAQDKVDKGKLTIRHNLYRATSKGNRVKSQTKEILVAIKNGKASNKDLSKSIESTKLAIKNLKNYLKS